MPTKPYYRSLAYRLHDRLQSPVPIRLYPASLLGFKNIIGWEGCEKEILALRQALREGAFEGEKKCLSFGLSRTSHIGSYVACRGLATKGPIWRVEDLPQKVMFGVQTTCLRGPPLLYRGLATEGLI